MKGVIIFAISVVVAAGAFIWWGISSSAATHTELAARCEIEGGTSETIGRWRLVCLTPDGRVKWIESY